VHPAQGDRTGEGRHGDAVSRAGRSYCAVRGGGRRCAGRLSCLSDSAEGFDQPEQDDDPPTGHVTFSGRVSPNQHGRTVWLQRYYGGHWHRIIRRTLSSTSRYSFRVQIDRKGTFTYRVHDYAHPGWKPGSSRKVSVRVVAATSGGGAGGSTQCYPLTNGGNCYEPGEYCRDSDHGMTGVAGDGERIQCVDDNGWRWEPV